MARARPGALNYGSPGVGTGPHLAMELFKLETKTFMLHVPYRGTAGYTQDLLAGELMVGFLPVHVAQGFVKTGKLVALAVGSIASRLVHHRLDARRMRLGVLTFALISGIVLLIPR